jgi:hypothetical protein
MRTTPVQGFNSGALAGSTWSDIAAGGEYSLAVRSDAGHAGEVWGCGGNGWGQLADGTTSTRTSPVQLGSPSLLSGITQVAASSSGNGNSLFYNGTTKTLYSVGYNASGQLGDGTTGNDAGCVQCRFKQVVISAGACVTTILPVELSSFTAECNFGEVKCKWATASESNNDYFTVERSENGINYIEIGKVKGAGSSSSLRNYEFIDELSSSTGSAIFYRLKQTDFDGKFEYFSAVSVSCSGSEQAGLVFQNPVVENELTGTLVLPDRAEVRLSVLDIQGRIITEEKLNVAEGSNLVKIKLDKIRKGVYLIKINNGENETVQKFIKL